MKTGKVIGTIWATRKEEKLAGVVKEVTDTYIRICGEEV